MQTNQIITIIKACAKQCHCRPAAIRPAKHYISIQFNEGYIDKAARFAKFEQLGELLQNTLNLAVQYADDQLIIITPDLNN